jgi:hypothetical protein
MIVRQLVRVALLALATVLTAASGRTDALPRTIAFAVVIGNNRTLEHRRPDLHYADDDAAKYFAILQTIAPERAVLLAELDDDTARLFPAARARAVLPTRAELLRVGREIAEEVRASARAGETEVYFVFAGHGDVDQGTARCSLSRVCIRRSVAVPLV